METTINNSNKRFWNKILFAVLIGSTILISGIITSCSNSEVLLDEFDESVNGKVVYVEPNKNFTIKLNSNPSTGYKWEWKKNDTEIIELVSSSYKSNSTNPQQVGVGGVETFVFKTIKKGRDTIELIYYRAWEKDVPPAKTISFEVSTK